MDLKAFYLVYKDILALATPAFYYQVDLFQQTNNNNSIPAL